ncbi:MAG: hypothetical protein ABJG15_15095 [Hyphomonadaceae bacterium]
MSIKVEIGLVVFTALAGLGVFHTSAPLEPQAPTERASVFAAADYAAFDRDFVLDGDTCQVGLERRKMCFTASPLQTRIIEGRAIPTDIPVLAAEFPILVAQPVKAESQRLLRYGTVLALIDEDTRMVEDVLYIDASTFADAARQPQTELVETGALEITG